jgi:hypothetical protein
VDIKFNGKMTKKDKGETMVCKTLHRNVKTV